MPISGLVLTFSSDVSNFSDAIGQLAAKSSIEIGEASGAKLALVVDTPSRVEDQEIWEWVHKLPGVERADVVFVGFEDSED